MKTYVGINGVAGRMGQRILALALRDPELNVSLALEAPNSPAVGQDAGTLVGHAPIHVPVVGEPPDHCRLHVLIDFSQPEGTMAALAYCRDRGIPILIATTGHSHEQRREIQAAAHETAVLHAPNTSLAVAVLGVVVRRAGELLRDKGFDCEIIERHHRLKKDAPSGTALHLAHVLQESVGKMDLKHGRSGHTGERPPLEIGIHALRAGDHVGEHTVVFGGTGEMLELTQRATSRDCYARGALQAAKYLVGRPAGKYTMADVLGL